MTGDDVHALLCLGEEVLLLGRNGHIVHRDGEGCLSRVLIAHSLDAVQHLGTLCGTAGTDAAVDDLTQLLLLDHLGDLEIEVRGALLVEADALRNRLVEDQAAQSDHGALILGILGVAANQLGAGDHDLIALGVGLHKASGEADADGCVDTQLMVGVSHHSLVHVAEHAALAGLTGLIHGEVVGAEDHILGRNGNSLTVHRLQEVVGGEHEESCLGLCLHGQGHVYRHLVAIEVGVERGTHQGVQLDGAALNQHGLECLDGQTVQGRCAVQQHGMLLDDVLQGVVDLGEHALDLLLGFLDVGCLTHLHQSLDHEGLEQLQSHLLRQTALIDLQGRTDNDNRTAGVVHALTQQVLTETTLLTAEHFGQRLEGTVGGAGNGLTAAAVVDQRVDGLLQHSLLVADDDIGGMDLKELLETVVTGDDAAVQLVQVRGGEAAAVQLDHGTDVGRNDGQDVQHHPLQLIAGGAEGLDDLQTLDDTGLLLARSALQIALELGGKLVHVDTGQQLLDCLGAHAHAELAAVHLAVLHVLLLVEDGTHHEGGVAGIQHHVLSEVQHLLQLLGGDIQHQSHTGGDGLEVPDVGYGGGQLDVTHALAANLLGGDVHAALLALDDLFTVGILIFAAHTSTVLGGTKDALAEQTADFGLQGAVVDGLGLLNLAVRPLADHIRRCQTDLNG